MLVPTEDAETPDLSIEDSLAAAHERVTASEPAETPVVPPIQASGEPEAAISPLEAPKHWTQADRDLFGNAPRNIQQRWIDREAEQARGLDAKFQEVAGFRRQREEFDEILKPYARDLETQGVSSAQFFKSLVGWHKCLQENPQEGLTKLAQQYGVDLSQAASTVDPNLSKLTQEIDQVKSQFTNFLTEAKQREHQAKLAQVNEFAMAADDKGQPLRPYFDEVAQDMLALMRAQNGLTLDQAYTKAVRMNDQVWEKSQAASKAAADKQAENDRLNALNKAKKAAVTGTQGTVQGTTRELSLEDEMLARASGTFK